MPPSQVSGVPKVFGIIHIIYAVLGGLAGLFGLGSGAVVSMAIDPLLEDAKDTDEDVQPLMDSLDSIMTISMIDSVLKLLFAALILVAGIKLLKYQQSGRGLSNIWAIARIVVAIPMTFFSIGAQETFQEELGKLSEAEALPNMGAIMGGVGLFTVILLCVYPVISLILLNKENVKSALK